MATQRAADSERSTVLLTLTAEAQRTLGLNIRHWVHAAPVAVQLRLLQPNASSYEQEVGTGQLGAGGLRGFAAAAVPSYVLGADASRSNRPAVDITVRGVPQAAKVSLQLSYEEVPPGLEEDFGE